MTTEHITDERLIGLADDLQSEPEAEDHVQSCSSCFAGLAFYRRLSEEMRADETWAAEQEIRTGRGSEAFRSLADRVAAEDAEAHRLLDELLESSDQFERADITADPRFHTGGVVRVLYDAVRSRAEYDVIHAMRIGEAARTIADALPDDYYPSEGVFELRGFAWQRSATVEGLDLGRYPEAFHALDRAEEAFGHVVDAGPGMAAVNATRAGILVRSRQFSESLRLCAAAAGEYRLRGDTRRFVETKEIEASALHMMREYLSARKIHFEALEAAEQLNDLERKATLLRNLGVSYRETGDFEDAGKFLLQALQVYEALGSELSIARVRRSIALMSLFQGNFVDAESQLRAAMRVLEEKALAPDVAEAKLDLAEALLMLGRPGEVEALCDEAEAFFQKAGIIAGRRAAVAFLRNAAANHLLQREHFEHVRRYLDETRDDPDRPFTPPRSTDH